MSIPQPRIPWLSILVVGLGFLAVVERFWELEVANTPGYWAADALPAALSRKIFHHRVGYTSLGDVRGAFLSESGRAWDAAHINEFIHNMSARHKFGPPLNGHYVWWGYDDKGIVDFMVLAFRIFGLHAESITKMYLLLLGLSIGAYTLAFYRSPPCLLLATAFLAGLYLLIPSIVHNPELKTVLALRCFPILSMMACLHTVLYVAAPAPKGVFPFLLASLQLGLILFVLHIRATTSWQLALLLLAAAVGLWRAWRLASAASDEDVSNWRKFLRVGAPTLCFLLVFLAGRAFLHSHQNAGYADSTSTDGKRHFSRVFWHSIYMGYALNPRMADQYDLRIDDHSVYAAAAQFLASEGRADEWNAIAPPGEDMHFDEYDLVVREMLVVHACEHPLETVSSILYYKPLSLGGNVLWLMGIRDQPPNLLVFTSAKVGDGVIAEMESCSSAVRSANQQACPWNPLALLLVLPMTLLPRATFRRTAALALAGATLLLMGSLVPSFLGYPAPWNSSEVYLATVMLLYLGSGLLVNKCLFRATDATELPCGTPDQDQGSRQQARCGLIPLWRS